MGLIILQPRMSILIILFNYDNGIRIPDNYLSKFKISYFNSVLLCLEGGSAGRKIGLLKQDVCFGNKLCNLSFYYGRK